MDQEIKSDFVDNDIISLYDIWKTLQEYKKIFWSIFLFTLMIGGSLVWFAPLKYVFSQVVEVGGSVNDEGARYCFMQLDDAVLKIKKVLYPTVVHMYNLSAERKLTLNAEDLKVERAGSNTLLLSMEGPLRDKNMYKVVLSEIIVAFAKDTQAYVEYKKKTLTAMKENLERRLTEMTIFYEEMLKKGIGVNVNKTKDLAALESKMISMYLNDQNAIMTQLTNTIGMLQAQILGTYNTRAISNLMISDYPVGPSKGAQLFLIIIVSCFFALCGVFIVHFIKSRGFS